MVWLAHHFQLPVYVLNDVELHSDPYLTTKFPNDWDKKSEWLVQIHGRTEEVRKEHKHCLMISFQDVHLKELRNDQDVFKDRPHSVGASAKQFTLLVLRDPFNLLASRWAKPVPLLQLLDPCDLLNAWEEYAREYLSNTGGLIRKIPVNYNLWFQSADYRKQLSKRLDLKFTDAGINTVPKAGDGSSFDLIRYDGRASQMKVIERWINFADDSRFRQAFSGRQELGYLYRQIFPPNPLLSAFLHQIGI